MTQNQDGTVNHFEVLTMQDKAQRDDIYRRFRTEGDEFERQAIKFSSSEIVLDNDGNPAYNVVESGKRKTFRPVYRSTWSVAYPTGRG